MRLPIICWFHSEEVVGHRNSECNRDVSPTDPACSILPSKFRDIIAAMKFRHPEVPIVLAAFVVGLTCMGQAATAQLAPSADAQALVKQGQKLNSEGKQDEALKLYQKALEMSPDLYEAHLESGVALDLKVTTGLRANT